ncbi:MULTISPECIES: hypothetical protein [Citrobacter]|uniref:hypothetical protein n=1 Tax=Citrobacter TaxID=544 RepID=UPI0023AA8DAE|nr:MULTISPECIES: hypothetical protein [Citrobacter]MDM2998974.1 hypothetical protein [Citrobacter sp. CK192]MDM3019806.1 hypothetical protein [Citrobacter sp. CK193]WEE19121.1 hypothetical protein PX343_09530 [Citrobacter koseri]
MEKVTLRSKDQLAVIAFLETNNLAAVARRYLPDYDEHPDIQAADDLLESAAGIQSIEGEG